MKLISMEQTKLGLILSCLAILLAVLGTAADPQTNLLNVGCSQYNATNHASFFANQNATFSDLSTQIAAGGGFATAQQARSADPVYALFQCRGYLSTTDCTACLGVAVAKIRGCAAANGARVIYDGCFLRYESAAFFDQNTLPGNEGVCGNKTDAAAGFAAEAVGLLSDLSEVVPRVKRYFAAAVRGGVYAVAQCAETVAEEGCRQCLAVAYENVKGCPPDGEGRAVDAGCFMRYSDRAFFGANQTVDLTAYLASGDSSKKVAIIGGVAGGVGVLILGFLLFFWIRRSRKPQNNRKGHNLIFILLSVSLA